MTTPRSSRTPAPSDLWNRARSWRPAAARGSHPSRALPRSASTDLPTPDLVAVSPHQDDEVLSMGPAILEAVAAGKTVEVLLVSRGEGSSVRTRQLPKHLGFVPSPHHFSALRDREFEGAVRAMGAVPLVPAYEDRLPDGAATAAAVTRLVRAHVPAGTAAFTISPYDDHPDHQACAAAVRRLAKKGHLSQASYFISPERLDLVPEGITLEEVGVATPVTQEHQHPYRVREIADNWWGIGARSVKESFDYQLRQDPKAYRHQ